MTKLWSTDTK